MEDLWQAEDQPAVTVMEALSDSDWCTRHMCATAAMRRLEMPGDAMQPDPQCAAHRRRQPGRGPDRPVPGVSE
jgi:hypothetical protein